MNILKKILKHEVFPALGCTEPIAISYAASTASSYTSAELKNIKITVDPGVYKNGFAVTIPNTNGEKGNLIAGVMGALIKKPELKMEILKKSTPEIIAQAKKIIEQKKASLCLDNSKAKLFIKIELISTKNEIVEVIIQDEHTNITQIKVNNQIILKQEEKTQSHDYSYKEKLKELSIANFIDIIENEIDDQDYKYILKGVDLNLEAAKQGEKLKKVGYYLKDLLHKGFISNDIFATIKIATASATDARMSGLNCPVMSSGGSGNQGIVAILVPYLVGKYFKIQEAKIVKSIALSHLINSYIKCYTGNLSSLCGCAIAAGVGAAVAIVYQQAGKDMDKIYLAINNLISDLGGMLCDGAKNGCAFKVASSADSSLRAAYMALNNNGITYSDGFVGLTGEDTIKNLSKIIDFGMEKANEVMLEIMTNKTQSPCL
ncbi:L-cysteine desulfidase [Desulfonauticus submarinus]|uniref:UPF0597 protein SAMN04488516_101130 n=1 Tax=Desulfonauticus submarinus TaxID=206665 RepID=A0A1G9ZQB5_9BACT|nr:L-serine ammonia-lyase, iron-sulfur-dependent, subunit alpha [Desulfonauticus submarinus]SDN23569.1 L-cysteine desulfidase [Desulfonauticus submarinus]